MSHLGFIRGFFYLKTDFICTFVPMDYARVPSGYFAAWYLRLRVQMVCRTWSSWPFEVDQVWSIWKHCPGKKGEATRCDFVVVVLVTNSLQCRHVRVPFPHWRHCLESLLHSPRAALVCEADEGEIACGSLLRHDL